MKREIDSVNNVDHYDQKYYKASLKSGKLYSLDNFIWNDDNTKYFFQYDLSNLCGEPVIERAKCSTIEEAMYLLKQKLPNSSWNISNFDDDVESNCFYMSALITNDQFGDMRIEITISNLKTGDDEKLKEIYQTWIKSIKKRNNQEN